MRTCEDATSASWLTESVTGHVCGRERCLKMAYSGLIGTEKGGFYADRSIYRSAKGEGYGDLICKIGGRQITCGNRWATEWLREIAEEQACVEEVWWHERGTECGAARG